MTTSSNSCWACSRTGAGFNSFRVIVFDRYQRIWFYDCDNRYFEVLK